MSIMSITYSIVSNIEISPIVNGLCLASPSAVLSFSIHFRSTLLVVTFQDSFPSILWCCLNTLFLVFLYLSFPIKSLVFFGAVVHRNMTVISHSDADSHESKCVGKVPGGLRVVFLVRRLGRPSLNNTRRSCSNWSTALCRQLSACVVSAHTVLVNAPYPQKAAQLTSTATW